jgi:hypothetical protein
MNEEKKIQHQLQEYQISHLTQAIIKRQCRQQIRLQLRNPLIEHCHALLESQTSQHLAAVPAI